MTHRWLVGGLLACSFLSGCSRRPVLLHFDNAPLNEPVVATVDASLQGIYGQAGVRVSVRPVLRNGLDASACLDVSEMDAQMLATRSLKGILLDQATPKWDFGRYFRPWYVHGLSLPCCIGSIGGSDCSGYAGLIWLGLNFEDGVREHFVVFTKSYAPEDRMMHTVHELGHVLNLHHCEYDTDRLRANLKFDMASVEHLRDHPVECVRPGEMGKLWCDMTDAHRDLHQRFKATPSCASDDFCNGAASIFSTSSPEGMELAVVAEKKAYVEGEPIRVDVVVRGLASGVAREMSFLGERSLDPNLGYLRFWASTSRNLRHPAPEAEFRPLGIPVLAETTLSLVSFNDVAVPAGLAASGLDIWNALPREGVDVTGPFFIKVTLGGFLDTARHASLVAASAAGEIAIVRPPLPLFDAGAHALFTSQEARRFFFLLGGDHLVSGRDDLAKVARDFPETIFAPYANLALGVSLSRPFQAYDAGSGSAVLRSPKLDEAREYLESADRKRSLLSRSYQVILDRALAQTHSGLGDRLAASDPTTALGHYRLARQHLLNIATAGDLGRPLSLIESRDRAGAEEALEMIAEKTSRLRLARS